MIQRRAILYIRVSTDEQADGYSLDYQEERLRNYCSIQNIQIIGVYKEDFTAKHFDRPEFKKLLLLLKKSRGIADLLLFLRWDRFSRNTGDAYGMINTLHKLQVEPQAVEQPLDLSIPENKMMLAFYLAAPEVENDRRALNTLVNMRKARKGGRWLGKAPKGYLNGKDEQGKPLLIPDSKNAPLIRWIFEEMSQGTHDIEAVRRMAKAKGFVVSRGQFWNLVRNDVYCGKVFINAYKDEKAHSVRGIHEPLVSELLFEEVQDVLNGRKRKTKIRSAKDEHLPLRGFLICPVCERILTGSGSSGNGGKFYYYHCQTASKCKVRFRADDAHKLMVETLEKITARKNILDLYYVIMSELFKKNGLDKFRESRAIQADIDKTKQRIQNAQALMLDGELTAEEYRDIRNSHQPQLALLEQKKIALLSSDNDYQRYLDEGIPMLQNIAKAYTEATIVEKQRLIGSMFSEKLIFSKNQYRTTTPNPLLKLISTTEADFDMSKKEKGRNISDLSSWVPRNGFEPSHPCERCDLNTVRLPISPPGHTLF